MSKKQKVVVQPVVQPEVVAAVVKKTQGIGKFVRVHILAGQLSNNEILEMVKKTHPTAKTTYACIAWYKSKMRKAGEVE